MEWYYSANNERQGPVSAGEFSRLVSSGVIQPETLVWHDGMSGWQPCREVETVAPSPAAMCAECGAMFAENELVQIDGRQVCAGCKPVFLQRVREGVESLAPDKVLDQRLLSFPDVLRLSWSIWLKNFGVILLLTLLTAIPANTILDLAAPGAQPTTQEIVRHFRLTMLLQLMLGSISAIGIAYVVGEAVSGREAGFVLALKHAFSRWLSAVGTGFLENIIVGFLFLLLIVPGVIWLGYYTFSLYVVALRQRGGKDALDYSKDLVKGRWWRVIGFVFALGVITMFPMLVVESAASSESGVLSVATSTITDVFMSFMTVAIGVLFLNLDALKRAGRL